MITLGVKGVLIPLLDSGSTRCLVSSHVVKRLRTRLRKLKKPIAFPQPDGSITGGVPVTYLTKPVKLKAGTRTEIIYLLWLLG